MQPKKIPVFDFVEILKRDRQSFLGALCTVCIHPRRPGIPHIAIFIRRLMKNLDNEGARGCSPWVGSPSGRERGSPS